MITLILVAFALSALLGLLILIKWLSSKTASRPVIYSHGLVAAAALGLLVYYALMHPDNFPKVSLLLFIIAALGGFYMFFNDMRNKTSPLAVAFVHALLAVGGFVLLLFFAIA